MNTRNLDGHLMPTIDRIPLIVEHAEGACLYDDKGKKYVDLCADVGTVSLGYCNKDVLLRMQHFMNQAHPHQLADILPNEVRWECAQKLCLATGMDKVFFANSGTEANETAIKLARKYHHDRETGKYVIATVEGHFCGRTGWALAATDSSEAPYHKIGFGPMPTGFTLFRDLQELNSDNVAAIIMAPILGNNTVRLYTKSFLQSIRDFCDKHDILLIFDEIQVGMGRCGSYTAYEQFGIRPDVLTLGKGMALGWPMSACLAHGEAAKVLGPRTHYTTFGGGPFVCKMNLILLDWLSKGGLEHIDELSAIMYTWLKARDWIKGFDGLGVHYGFTPMFGLFGYNGYQFAERAREFGVIVATFREFGQIKLTPPLNITRDELMDGLNSLHMTHLDLIR